VSIVTLQQQKSPAKSKDMRFVISCYFFSRLLAEILAADLSSFTRLGSFVATFLRLAAFPGLAAFFTVAFFFAGFALRVLADFFTIIARN
jgi:hypothetical protein